MLSKDEKDALIDLIEDEMQMDDWDTSYTKEMKDILLSALGKLKGN